MDRYAGLASVSQTSNPTRLDLVEAKVPERSAASARHPQIRACRMDVVWHANVRLRLPCGARGGSLDVMAETTVKAAPELEGEAGYLSPYPYLDKLQEKMEERLARRVPATGRFCGFCYARLREADTRCGFCGTMTSERPTVAEIPQDVLRLYKKKQKTESSWVHGGAFFGLILSSMMFIWLELWGPGILGHPATGFAALIGGGYLLAQLFGTFIGAQIGYRKGARKRDDLWAKFLAARDGDDSSRQAAH